MPQIARLVLVMAAFVLGSVATVAAQSCRQSVGPARAQELVRQCRQVSPATNPPCNDANPCAMMTEEITRGCGMYPSPRPAFCAAASPSPAPAVTRYSCPSALDGHALLNWELRDAVSNRIVNSEGQADIMWKFTPAQAARGSIRLVCGYSDTRKVVEIAIGGGLRQCLNPEMTSRYECK